MTQALIYQQHEFERLLKEKLPHGNFFKHPNGSYVDPEINLAYTGWSMAKAHSIVLEKMKTR
ncbi:hypothetical protein D3C72_1504550 [compost metagenome]